MSLQSELTRLQANVASVSSAKDDIMTALASKGVTVPAGATLHDVPNLIGQIEGMAPSNLVTIGGRTYKTVKIGSQIWMAENLSLDAGDWVEYPNEPERGKYYRDTTSAAIPFSAITNELPIGWRIPTSSDFNALITYCSPNSGTKLKSIDGWLFDGNGTNEFGFNAKPYQRYMNPNVDPTPWGDYTYGSMARFWTSDMAFKEEGRYCRKKLDITYGSSDARISYHFIDNVWLNIRLVKDAT